MLAVRAFRRGDVRGEVVEYLIGAGAVVEGAEGEGEVDKAVASRTVAGG